MRPAKKKVQHKKGGENLVSGLALIGEKMRKKNRREENPGGNIDSKGGKSHLFLGFRNKARKKGRAGIQEGRRGKAQGGLK